MIQNLSAEITSFLMWVVPKPHWGMGEANDLSQGRIKLEKACLFSEISHIPQSALSVIQMIFQFLFSTLFYVLIESKLMQNPESSHRRYRIPINIIAIQKQYYLYFLLSAVCRCACAKLNEKLLSS